MNDILDALVVYNPKNNKIRLESSGNGNGDGGYVIIDGKETLNENSTMFIWSTQIYS